MDFVLDVSTLNNGAQPLVLILEWITQWWWVALTVFFLFMFWEGRINIVQERYFRNLKHVMLAIDVPRENEQNLKAVEQIFAALHGAHEELTWYKKNILGKIQDHFSLEIISIGGQIQFLIRTQEEYRDLVESSIYAQYPDAAVMGVEDYTNVDIRFPNDEYELWGTGLVLYNQDPYPIRTHMFFEHGLSQTFVDPMASILEVMSALRRGEQIWLQLVIAPTSESWIEKGQRIVNKLIGEKAKAKSRFGTVGNVLQGTVQTATASLYLEEDVKKEKEKDKKNRMQELSPGQRATVEAIEIKMGKLAFRTRFRLIYLAEKGVYSKPRGVAAMMGGIKQFNTLDLNGFKPDKYTRTKVRYVFKKRRLADRQNRILSAYRNRRPGEFGPLLNIEELATIYHFPLMTVKAPFVQKTDARRSEPPAGLPVQETRFATRATPGRERISVPPPNRAPITPEPSTEEAASPAETPNQFQPRPQAGKKASPGVPDNLPFVE